MPSATIDLVGTVVSSAVVGAIVAAIASFFTQRYLLERKARVDYEYSARTRLHEIIGPLRMQLLFAARDVVRRTRGHAAQDWNLDPDHTYARTFIYRLLRPLAIAQIIERKMALADFSVDRSALALLRFNTAVERLLTGDDVVRGLPDVDWRTQSQHIFRDNLRAAASVLIVDDETRPYVMEYARFQQAVPDLNQHPGLRELAAIFRRCDVNLSENAVFWVRIVGYSYACTRFIADNGIAVGFEDVPISIPEMLGPIDPQTLPSAREYEALFASVIAQGL